jgi:hypothetical protein
MDEFTRRLNPLNLSQTVKADLWEVKARCVPRKAVAIPDTEIKSGGRLPKGLTPLPADKSDWVDVPGSSLSNAGKFRRLHRATISTFLTRCDGQSRGRLDSKS